MPDQLGKSQKGAVEERALGARAEIPTCALPLGRLAQETARGAPLLSGFARSGKIDRGPFCATLGLYVWAGHIPPPGSRSEPSP